MARKRKSVKRVIVDQNVRCQRIFPIEESKTGLCSAKHSTRWTGKTIALQMTKDQAVHLARALLAATQEWNEIDITAFRFQRRAEVLPRDGYERRNRRR